MNKTEFIKKTYENLNKSRKKRNNNYDYTFNVELDLEEFNEIELLLWNEYDSIKVKKNSKISSMTKEINEIIEKVLNVSIYKMEEKEICKIINLKEDYINKKYFMYIPFFVIHGKIIEKYNIESKKMNIYRLEIDNMGFYSYAQNAINDLIEKIERLNEKTPIPENDGILKSIYGIDYHSENINAQKFFFGFKSIKELIKWFNSEMIKELNNNSIEAKIVKYEIEDKNVLSSENQSCFYIERAIKKEEYSIYDYENLIKEEITVKKPKGIKKRL